MAHPTLTEQGANALELFWQELRRYEERSLGKLKAVILKFPSIPNPTFSALQSGAVVAVVPKQASHALDEATRALTYIRTLQHSEVWSACSNKGMVIVPESFQLQATIPIHSPFTNAHASLMLTTLTTLLQRAEKHLTTAAGEGPRYSSRLLAFCQLFGATVAANDHRGWMLSTDSADQERTVVLVRLMARLWRLLLILPEAEFGIDATTRVAIESSLSEFAESWAAEGYEFRFKPSKRAGSKRSSGEMSRADPYPQTTADRAVSSSVELPAKRTKKKDTVHTVYEIAVIVGELAFTKVCVFGGMTWFNLHRCLQIVFAPNAVISEVERMMYSFEVGGQTVGTFRGSGVVYSGKLLDLDALLSQTVAETLTYHYGSQKNVTLKVVGVAVNVERYGPIFKAETMPRCVPISATDQKPVANLRLCILRFSSNPGQNKKPRQGPCHVIVSEDATENDTGSVKRHIIRVMSRGIAEELGTSKTPGPMLGKL